MDPFLGRRVSGNRRGRNTLKPSFSRLTGRIWTPYLDPGFSKSGPKVVPNMDPYQKVLKVIPFNTFEYLRSTSEYPVLDPFLASGSPETGGSEIPQIPHFDVVWVPNRPPRFDPYLAKVPQKWSQNGSFRGINTFEYLGIPWIWTHLDPI